MITNKPVVVIHNTTYHFETALSIYQSLLALGLDVYFHALDKDVFLQKKFLAQNNIKLATKNILEEACCGFVVSAYPNPHVSEETAIPNHNDYIFCMLKNKLIYISHRFKKHSDYNQNINSINKENSLCLSPLAKIIGIDYFNPIELPIQKKYLEVKGSICITIQGHFELKSRENKIIFKLIENLSENIKVNFVGTSASSILTGPNRRTLLNNKLKFFKNLNESFFYEMINNHANFIMPCIDNKTKGGTYANERYSSNFNLSLALEKPIFCHEFFKEIYKIPGIYYNEENFIDKLNLISNFNETQYSELVNSFKPIKKEYEDHNNKIIEKKIRYIIEN